MKPLNCCGLLRSPLCATGSWLRFRFCVTSARQDMMEPERWQEIERLYHLALGHEESRRAEFLEQACGGDEALRREVESLLAYAKPAQAFMEAPSLGRAALTQEQTLEGPSSEMVLRMVGRTVAHYRIVEKL